MKNKKPTKKYKLKRELGFWEVTLTGIGIILGAGIYALIGEAAGLAGNGAWLAFLIAALLAALTGMSYAEFSSMFPKSGAEYVYTKKSFGPLLAFLIGWLVILSGILGASTVSLGFGGYFAALFSTPILPVAFALILVLSFVIFLGIKQSTRIAVAFTLIEAAGLVLIISIGVPHFGSVDYLAIPDIGSLMSAAALIFFAYMGFEEMVRLSEETKNAKKVIPIALLVAIAVTTVMYILVAISAVSILSPAELAASASPIADVAAKALGPDAFILLSVIALFSTANTALLMLLSSSRISYGMAREGSLPALLGRIHPSRRTPHFSILLAMLIAVAILILMSDISMIANITNFTLFITFLVVNLGVIVMRFKAPRQKRPFRVPGSIGRVPLIPALGAFASFAMLFSLSIEILAYGVLLMLAGWLFHKIIN